MDGREGRTRRALLGAVASATVLGACSGPGGPSERSPIQGVSAAGKITYTLWPINPEATQNLAQRLAEFQAQHPGVQVETVYSEFGPFGATYREKLVSMLSSGAPPDVMTVESVWMPDFAQRAVIQRLDGYARGDRGFKLDDFLPGAVLEHHHLFRGVLYGLPNAPESPRVIFYHKTKWLENGLPLPTQLDQQGRWTWDAFVEHATRVTKGAGEEKTFGIPAYFGVVPEAYAFIASNGGKWLSDDLQSFVGDMPESAAAMQLQADLIHKHQVAPRPTDNLGPGNTLLSGRLAAQMTGIWTAASLFVRPDFDYGVAPPPRSPKGLRRTVIKPNALTIPVGIKGPPAAAAWEVIKFINSLPCQKGQIDAGQWLTNRKDGVDYFVQRSPVKDSKVFMDLFAKQEVLNMPLIPRWIDYKAVVDEEFNRVARGELAVPAALATIKARVAGLLKM